MTKSKQVMEWQGEARAEGRAETLLEVIQERLGELPSETADKILKTADIRLLKRWTKIASRAENLGQFLNDSGLSKVVS